jgi:hypothetical protein
VTRVDLVVLPEADPFLALEVIRGGRDSVLHRRRGQADSSAVTDAFLVCYACLPNIIRLGRLPRYAMVAW